MPRSPLASIVLHMAMTPGADAPSARIGLAVQARTKRPIRPEGRSQGAPGNAARELDAEVTRLLRVRRGELAEPRAWGRHSLWRRVNVVVAQLEPIRSRAALLSSWQREAHRGPDVRLAYALAWLSVDRRAAVARVRRRRARATFSPITAHA